MDISVAERGTAFDLFRKQSTLKTIEKYLGDKSLPSSAPSWPVVFKRLAGFLSDGRLQRSDLLKMLRDVEEFGRQHIFLHRCSKKYATELINETMLAANLAKLDLSEILAKPPIIGKSKGLQLVEARIETPKKGGMRYSDYWQAP